MGDTPTRFERETPQSRVDRHRPQVEPVPARAPVPPPPRPAKKRAPARRAAAPLVHDQTPDALRRPAQVSDRCSGCGASTRGRSRMITELVEVGPVRALRVVACSACPDRRRRDVVL